MVIEFISLLLTMAALKGMTGALAPFSYLVVNNCLNTNIYSYLETSDGQSSNLYLNVVHFFNAFVNYTSVAA